jgi:16S rRNA (guanine527-N7)-methyltransferase
MARAVAPLPVLVEYAAPLLRVGGTFVAWKGAREPDVERAGEEAAAQVGLRLGEILKVTPFEGAHSRHLHVFEKTGPTPERFPRRPGMAAKRPLA